MKEITQLPRTEQLERELARTRDCSRRRRALRGAAVTLMSVAAAAILVATLWLPILRIYGTSMAPNLRDGDICFTAKTARFRQGDMIAFYYNNKILVKRVIAQAGDWVDMDKDGTVYVNGEAVNEPYLLEKSPGETDISFPYQVAEGRIFVMGDNRATSIDSRNSAVGCVSQEQIVGRILFRIWPLNRMGTLS